jgi:hypothetical protein
MFETGEEMSRNEGLKGIFHRHFGPVLDLEQASDGIRSVAKVLLGLAGLTAVVGPFLVGPQALVSAILFAIPALVLLFKPSRAAAIVLLVLTTANAILSLAVLPWIWVLFAARGTQLTFAYHRLRKEATVADAFS